MNCYIGKILGLDCATKTGWAIFDCTTGGITESGVEDFKKMRGESNGVMFLRFRRWLKYMISDDIDLVIYEKAHHRGGAATEICVNLTGRVQEIADENDVQYASVHTAELKKFATGKGNASKDEMIVSASRWLGRVPVDDNEADAVHIARWGAKEFVVVS